MNRTSAAASAYRALVARYPGREVAGSALWRLGWISFLAGDAKTAEQTWKQLSTAASGRSYRTSALYWTARAHEQRAGATSAAPLYRQVLAEAPRSYYGVLATARVSGAPESPEPSVRLPADPRDAIG